MGTAYHSRTVRLPEDLAATLGDLAALWGCSINGAVVRAIRRAVEAEKDRLEALRSIRGAEELGRLIAERRKERSTCAT